MKPLSEALLYGIADLGYIPPDSLETTVEKMLLGGVDLVQLRAKGFEEHSVESFARRIVPLTESAGVPLILNDHPALVPSVGAQGAHVGQDDFSVGDARWRSGRALSGEVPPTLIGKSTHSFDQAVAAQNEGADYIGFGPLFATPTKPGRPAIGLDLIAKVHQAVSLPVFCIGGIKLENLRSILDAGARRVVVVSGILQSPDIVSYCRDLRSELQSRFFKSDPSVSRKV
jgi:thiamine-phosphate pyrophosphorylase